MMKIRPATTDDAAELLAIYTPYVEETAITFELEPPTLEDFRGRIADISSKYPYLVAEDDSGRLLGYTYAHAFRERAAYNHCVEMTIYLARDMRGKDIARQLYEALEEELRRMGIINLCASITWVDEESRWLTHASIRFHTKMGYTKVAHFHKCGHKFNQWFDMIWMEKFIAKHE